MAIIRNVTQLHENGIRPINEDTVLVDETSHIYGVFDGVSSLDKYVASDGTTGGYIASHTAADIFSNSSQNLAASLLQADHALQDIYKRLNIDTSSSVHRFGTTVAIVKMVDDNHTEIMQVSDSLIIVLYKDGRAEVPLGYHDQDLEIMRKWRKLADAGTANIRQVVADDVIKLREASNTTYGVLNGDGNAARFAKTGSLDLDGVEAILLITDGMLIPKANPDAEENWHQYASLFRQSGLRGIYEYVRKLERSDPHLTKYPRYKIHDDASGIAIELA